MQAKNRIFVNADKSKVVDEGSPEAAFLLVGEGGEVSDEDIEKYGLKKSDLMEAKAVEFAPEDKAVNEAPENKAVEPKTKKAK